MVKSTLAVLCDEFGQTQCGSDGYLRVDGRFTRQNQLEYVRKYRDKFKTNFPYKYDAWTHVMFVRNLSDLNDYNPLPYKWRL